MKVIMLNTSDRQGGAAVAASRLRQALEKNGIDSKLIVRDKQTNDPAVVSINRGTVKRNLNRFRFLWERLGIWRRNGFTKRDLFTVSSADTGIDFSRMREVREADIIHLHWTNQGMLSLRGLQKLLALGKPVVWTMHDMWPATGICHHAWECDRYKSLCGRCPFLHSTNERDLSTRIFKKKSHLYIYSKNLTLVPVSHWLQGKCRESALTRNLRIQAIPNPIDTVFFAPGHRLSERKRWKISPNQKVLLMGAAKLNDPVKGFSYLTEALAGIKPELKQDLLVILFGTIKDDSTLLENFPVPVRWLGSISSAEAIRSLYRMADFFMIPSLEDNLPNTVMESLSCGTPVIGFRTGGIPEMVDHLENGWLAPRKDIGALSKGIEWGLEHSDPAGLSENSRRKVMDRFTIPRIARLYTELYRSLLEVKATRSDDFGQG